MKLALPGRLHSTTWLGPALAVGGWLTRVPWSTTDNVIAALATGTHSQTQAVPEHVPEHVEAIPQSESIEHIWLALGPLGSQRESPGSTVPMSDPLSAQVAAPGVQSTPRLRVSEFSLQLLLWPQSVRTNTENATEAGGKRDFDGTAIATLDFPARSPRMARSLKVTELNRLPNWTESKPS